MKRLREKATQGAKRTLHTLLTGILLAGALAACSSNPQPDPSALAHFNKGVDHYLAGEYAQAIRRFNRSLSLDPMAADTHYNLGLAYYHTGAYSLAAESYLQAVNLRPDFADAYLNLALAYNRLYDLDSADLAYNTYQQLMAQSAAESAAREAAVNQAANQPGQPGQSQGGGQGAGTRRVSQQQPGTGGPQGNNPFEGKTKWWTQDTTRPGQ